jgi:hypothetical protein
MRSICNCGHAKTAHSKKNPYGCLAAVSPKYKRGAARVPRCDCIGYVKKVEKKETFVEVNERNDWQYLTFHLGPLKMLNAGTNGSLEKHPPQVKEGPTKMLWPDGTVQDVTIQMRLETNSYTEQGQYMPTSVTSRVPYVKLELNGHPVEVCITELKRCKFLLEE